MVLVALEEGSANAAETILNAARTRDIENPAFDETLKSLDLTALDVLTAGLKDSDEHVRIAAAYALTELGDELYVADDDGRQGKPDPAKAAEVARLARPRFQGDRRPDTGFERPRHGGALGRSLGAAHPGAGETDHGNRVIEALIAMLNEKVARMAPGTQIVLACWFDDGGGTSRCGRNANGEPLRIAAIQALVGFGERAAPAVPALIDALHDGDPCNTLVRCRSPGRDWAESEGRRR